MLPPLLAPTPRLSSARPSAWKTAGALGLVLLITLPWALLMTRFGNENIYPQLGPVAAAALLVVAVAQPRRLHAWLVPSAPAVVTGVGVGIAMTALTYPLFHGAAWLLPRLNTDVAALYAGAGGASLSQSLAWVGVIVVAEEVLWRGVLLEALREVLPSSWAIGLAVVSYAAAQLGTGSLLVVSIALGCGALWTLQRLITGSVLSAVISHAIWTPTVVLLCPVV